MEETNLKQNKKPRKIEEMTKEQIRQAIIKKQECNAKAQRIVESLLDKEISDTYFIQCLPEINQCHFEDVIEERCIIHLCGYPLCHNSLHERDIPKQKYRISVKTNKVYDITARKSFCSNSCYKSAMHIKKQMLTSPLWFREYEEMPLFSLLPLDTIGSLGQEVDLSIIEPVGKGSESQTFTSINDFTNATLNAMGNDGEEANNTLNNIYKLNSLKTDSKVIASKNIVCDDKYDNKTTDKNLETNTDLNQDKKLCYNQVKQQIKQESVVISKQNKTIPNPLNIVGEIIEKPVMKIDPILNNTSVKTIENKNVKSAKKLHQKKQPSVTTITIEVEKCLAEWFTVDTLIFIFGDKRVKEMVTDKGKCIKEYLSNYAQSIFYNSNTYDQYHALCRKLNMLELEDRKYDAKTMQREMKPLPDYSILQEESKKMQLKVKGFLTGNTEILVHNDNDKQNISEGNRTEDRPTQLPLVDKNAQNALRRRIVCQHLNKVLPDLLRSLKLSSLTISSDVRLLVNTFKLRANNIMFKSIQWNLIAIIFIKLLSLRDERLRLMLEQPIAFQHMQLLLLSYKQDGGYLDRLISWLTDVDRLLDVNDTQLTIE